MSPEPPAENPFASPGAGQEAVLAEAVEGATWHEDRVTVEFTPDLDDYVVSELYRAVISARHARWNLVKVALLFALVPWMCVLFSANPARLIAEIWIWAILVPFILFLLAGPWRGKATILKAMLEPMVTADADEYLVASRVVFAPEGHTVVLPYGHRFRHWHAVEKVVSLPDHFLFVRGKVVALFLPKRAFAGPDEVERFATFVRQFAPVTTE